MKIFVASTGRCGTKFMQEQFNGYFTSFHEYRPHCIGKTMENINNSDVYTKETEEELSKKIREVNKRVSDGVYCETSQAFIKSYAPRILDEFKDVYCIYLFREPAEVAKSWKSRKVSHNKLWHLRSHWKKNILKTGKLPLHKNILWECEEVKERYFHLKPQFKKSFEFDFKDINNPQEWSRLFKYFKIGR